MALEIGIATGFNNEWISWDEALYAMAFRRNRHGKPFDKALSTVSQSIGGTRVLQSLPDEGIPGMLGRNLHGSGEMV